MKNKKSGLEKMLCPYAKYCPVDYTKCEICREAYTSCRIYQELIKSKKQYLRK